MDTGTPTSYQALRKGVPVFASDGTRVGTVASVLADAGEDIFHGLLIHEPGQGTRFAPAEVIASLGELGVELRIDAFAAAGLGPPERSAPVFGENPALGKLGHWARRLTGRGDWQRRK